MSSRADKSKTVKKNDSMKIYSTEKDPVTNPDICEFYIDFGTNLVIRCLGGHVPKYAGVRKGQSSAHFPIEACANCEFCEKCRSKRQTSDYVVRISLKAIMALCTHESADALSVNSKGTPSRDKGLRDHRPVVSERSSDIKGHRSGVRDKGSGVSNQTKRRSIFASMPCRAAIAAVVVCVLVGAITLLTGVWRISDDLPEVESDIMTVSAVTPGINSPAIEPISLPEQGDGDPMELNHERNNPDTAPESPEQGGESTNFSDPEAGYSEEEETDPPETSEPEDPLVAGIAVGETAADPSGSGSAGSAGSTGSGSTGSTEVSGSGNAGSTGNGNVGNGDAGNSGTNPAATTPPQSTGNASVAPDQQFQAVYSSDGEPLPYLIYVSKDSFTIAILGLDDDLEYTVLLQTYSTAIGRTSAQTRAGTFSITSKTRWIDWSDGTHTPYGTGHSGGLWFHGPIYNQKDPHSLRTASYNAIGTNATAGCLRTTTANSLWIYNNIPIGTRVIIANDSRFTSAVPARIDDGQTFDPTDPDVHAVDDFADE